jgi:hypothetical protein
MSPKKGIVGKTDVASRVREAHALRTAFVTACLKQCCRFVILAIKRGLRRCMAAVARARRA